MFMHGLGHTSKKSKELYSKGVFQNAYPAAVACWISDTTIKTRFMTTEVSDVPHLRAEMKDIEDAFCGQRPSELHFDFEAEVPVFSQLHSDKTAKLTKCDIVVSTPLLDRTPLRGFENKLTVIPDKSTSKSSPDLWAPEMVIRPATVATAVSSLFLSMDSPTKADLISSFHEYQLDRITDWKNETEVSTRYEDVQAFVLTALRKTQTTQTPFLLHTYWATCGQSWLPHQDASDMLVWSDHSVLSLIYREAMDKDDKRSKPGQLRRAKRSVVRMAVMLSQLVTTSRYNYASVFKQIGYGGQTDKEISINGKKMLKHVGPGIFSDRRIKLPDLMKIIPREGFLLMGPERRKDASPHNYFLLREAGLSEEGVETLFQRIQCEAASQR